MKAWIDNDGDVVWCDDEDSYAWNWKDYLADGCNVDDEDDGGLWMILE